MTDFVISKKVYLGFLGEDYAESYLRMRSITLDEREQLVKDLETAAKSEAGATKVLIELIKGRFIDGRISHNGELVELKIEELGRLPFEAYTEVLNQLSGNTDPNS